MFERKKNDSEDAMQDEGDDTPGRPPLRPFSRTGSPTPARAPATATFRAEPNRRGRPAAEPDTKRLTVGRDIHIKGEIASCDKLVVEGRVEATLHDARALEIAQGGTFRGNCEVDEADISGTYEGQLVARAKLTVRANGRLSGSIRYGRIVIEAGGEVSGDMQTLTPAEGRVDSAPESERGTDND
jgi:cytoskeletal protein CcmA (bactofilin family)